MEKIIRGYATGWCDNHNSKAQMYYINDACWSIECEFGCVAEDNIAEESFWVNHTTVTKVHKISD